MKKIKKEDIFLLIKKFEKVNETIEKEQQADIDILVECQSSAMNLGNYIEHFYEDMNIIDLVHKLEEYCEFLYQLSLSEQGSDIKKISKKIRKLLFSIESDVRYVLPKDKKVVVFLPYKASMWDSLESIYLAAKEDAECEAYVIPIPYFDKKSDGSFGEMHYEGNDFPENIPITSWKEFSIEESRPNTIFVHNPYDSWNLVTSVHTKFYCSELKKYTDNLIYVPYFVLHEIKREDRVEVNKINHFIFTPGVIYADKVIVQSEEMKRIYVSEFIEWAKKQKLPAVYTDRKYQNNRIQAIGSPKFDKLFSEQTKLIPSQWKEKIGNDKNRKKIIFFNTNVSLLLNNGDYFVKNLQRIERILERYSNKYVVIWREHPLTYETIKSMRSQVLKEYLEFKENFKKHDWVIIDDLSEWHTSADISDCYYGAGGSLSALYLATKKPIMITDYHYPNGIVDKKIDIVMLLKTMNKKHYYNEKFSNSLELFLEEFQKVAEYQRKCLDFLPEPKEIGNLHIGEKIYNYCCN